MPGRAIQGGAMADIKMTSYFKTAAVALVMAFALLAGAYDAQAQSTAQKPRHPALDLFEKQGGIVDSLGKAGDLDSYILVTADKTVKTVYVSPNGMMIMGILVDEHGENLTAEQLKTYRTRGSGTQDAVPDATASKLSKSEKIYALAERANWVRVGDEKAPYMYIFVNTTCDHCQGLWRDLQGAVAGGKLQLRIVPFGKADENRDSGAALLSVDNPGAAWQSFMDGNASALSKDKIKPGALEKMAANTDFYTKNINQMPPFTLYRRPGNGEVTALIGRPENVMVILADVISE